MSRVCLRGGRFHRTFTYEAALRTLLRLTELSEWLVRIIAQIHDTEAPQLLQPVTSFATIRRLWAISSAG